MNETALQRKIQQWIADEGGKVIKIHGNEFVEKGTPDLIGMLPVQINNYPYRIDVPLYLEVKLEGNEPTAIQQHRINQWSAVGACAGVVRSVEDVKELITQWMLEDIRSIKRGSHN